MDLLEQVGMLTFSLLHLPIQAIIVGSLMIPWALVFTSASTIDTCVGTNLNSFSTVVMLISGTRGIMFVLVPFLTAIFVDDLLTDYDIYTILWYIGVVVGTAGFNIGASVSYYWYGLLV